MSLRIWLPLNGTLENKGLDDIVVTNNGTTVDNSGKIGKCYSFNGSNYITFISDYLKSWFSNKTHPFSFCAWIYLNADETDRVIIFGKWNHNPFINWELTGAGVQTVAWGPTNNYVQKYSNAKVSTLTWTHIAAVFDGINLSYYFNGELDNTQVFNASALTSDFTSNLFYIGSDTRSGVTRLKGKMNDFRVYDHALSPLEVKQISQGLVLHYPLNRNGWGQENLITGYDTSFLSYPDGAVTLFNNQMNGGAQEVVSNISGASKCLHLHSNGDRSRQYNTLNLSSGKSYTISCEYYSTTSQPYPFRGELQGGNYTWFGSDASAYTTPNKWVNLSFSYLNLTSDTTIYYFIQCKQDTDCYIKNLKIEEGFKATPWCPNLSDELAIAMGLDNNIQYDTSGYGNNGIKTGNFQYDSDTPKYNVSTVFPSGVNWINAGRGAMVQDSITISCWINYSTWGNPISCTEGGGWNFEEGNGGIRAPFYISGIGYKTAQSTITSASLKNGWHMLTSLYDRINSIVKIFIDGELAGSLDTGTTNKIAYHGGNVIMIGAEAGGSATSPASTSFIGKISDVRIYCTALSAEDIKSLYNNSAYIDNQGNIYGAVYEEV